MVHRWPLRSVSCFIKFMQASRGMVNLQEKKKKKKKRCGGVDLQGKLKEDSLL